MLELLRANTGKRVTLGLRTPEGGTLEARIVRVLGHAEGRRDQDAQRPVSLLREVTPTLQT